jgi:hypothetical protein
LRAERSNPEIVPPATSRRGARTSTPAFIFDPAMDFFRDERRKPAFLKISGLLRSARNEDCPHQDITSPYCDRALAVS